MNTMKYLTLTALLTLTLASPAIAAVSVIVHPDNTSQMQDWQIRNIYLGKNKVFPDGTKVEAYELKEGSASRKNFLQKILNKSEASYNALWARMLFSSKSEPPIEAASDIELIQQIARNRNGIGYVDSSSVDSSVRVILVIE